jgi:anti-sigma B factor antagonist
MKIRTDIQDGIKFIKIFEVRIDSNISNEFKEYLSKELKDADKIILDCETLEFIDSSGLSALVFFYKNGKENNIQIKLVNVSEKVMSILQMTGLTKIFEIYSDIDLAKDSFE